MEQTAIKAGLPAMPPSSAITASPRPATAPSPKPTKKHWLYRCLEIMASLRITVVMFVFAMLLVFFGTWAQKDAGIFTVVNQYFHTGICWIPLRVLLMRSVDSDFAIPFPGGWVIGGLLLANLLAAHAIRFKMTWKRSGILLIHGGLILMMLGELFYGVWGVESRMLIMQGAASDHAENARTTELAIIDRSDAHNDREIVISENLLSRKNAVIQDPLLPFDVEVVHYFTNASFRTANPKDDNPATVGVGLRRLALWKPETTGVDTEQSVEAPAAYVTIKDRRTRKNLGTFLVSTHFTFLEMPPEEVTVDGKTYGISLRQQREYRSYQLQLIEFRHDKYTGTDIAKNYSSKVRLIDPSMNENRVVDIYMNNPLRYRGDTLFQADLHPLAKGTVLQVVHNRAWNWAWTLPYISCAVVTFGMLVHFGMHLFGFLKRRMVI